MDGWVDVCIHGWMDGWMDGQMMDGWLGRCVYTWMDGWVDGYNSVVHAHSRISFSLKKEGISESYYFMDA